ncbi:hypothetical protein HHL16_07785 [Pseudoflavitalea sp. G-6-1-2]|uniref:hypothetical protein n=1 Tax=Pseudoflavitalea sp. G-6-1-2 TaxID=2728841 RepID=UPI00146CDE0A|nr:hypothetical protein [Pseudoflavitalea sp. G-6-1-2]NML20770.1 hypothetical protein [Pseudoflavitalea sp. G-6-1-2]
MKTEKTQKKKKFKGGVYYGVKWIVDPSMNAENRKVMFPEKLARVNEILSKLVVNPEAMNK